MRVLLINHGYFGGGAERCVRELHQGLVTRGHEVEVWIANQTFGLPTGVKPICHPWERKLLPLDLIANQTDWRHRGSIRALKQATAEQFDLIHIHSISGGWMSLGALTQACQHVPSVWTLHDEWAVTNGYICDLTGKIDKAQTLEHIQGLGKLLGRSPYHDNLKNRAVGRLLDRLVPRSPLLIAPSQHILRLIRQCHRFDHSKAIQLYHGLSMLQEPARLQSRQEARQTWNIPPDQPVILMVAAHMQDFHKGMHLGLEAIRKIHADVQPHVFLLGKNASQLKKLLPSQHVTTGYAADNTQLAAAYRASDITLIPSLGESLSFVALESLACQTPVVAFEVGGPAEIIGPNQHGLTAKPYDTQQLVNHLQTLLADPTLRHTLGEAGSQWVKQHCDFTDYLNHVEDAYGKAIASFHPGQTV